ncbi:uncharacterized protein TNCV_649361 [Trichonephila clavipes]|nr:uncharacterized protein TNCV_649361 [Trichonephila clavipes]
MRGMKCYWVRCVVWVESVLVSGSVVTVYRMVCQHEVAGNIPVDIKKLRKYKSCIRKIACRKTALKTKKSTLVKQSGGLPLILPAVISGIAGLIGKAIEWRWSPGILIGHHTQKTELRLEDEVSKLLDREQLADDLKVKLLSQLLIRYQNIAREPSGPVRVSIVDENEHPKAVASQKMGEQFGDKMLENVKADAELDPILKDIITSSPRSYVKYIPSIVEKLITRGYS